MTILKENHQIMSKLVTDHKLLKICHKDKAPIEIIEYIEAHIGYPLTSTMKYVSDTNCPFYSKICEKWFEKFGLTLLEQSEYVMNVKDFVPIVDVVEMK
jgi:hypothetical protein